MAEWLLLRLTRSADESVEGLVVDDSGELRSEPRHAPLESFQPLAAGRRICALVPGAEVLQTTAELPRNAGRTPQIVAFALEEQVAEDIDTLQFAPGKAPAGSGLTPVHVVARRLMDDWLVRLRSAGLDPQTMYSDTELLPRNPQQITALIENDTLTVCGEHGPALTLPADDLATAFEFIALPTSTSVTQPLAEPGEPAPAPVADTSAYDLVVYAMPADWQRWSVRVEALRERFASLKAQLLTGGLLPLVAPQATASSNGINLLQGSYAPVKSRSAGLARWRLAAILAGALIAVHALGQFLELQHLKKTEAALDASVAQVFRSSMGEQNVTNARQRMQRRLDGVTAGRGNGRGLLDLLSAVASAHGTSPTTKVEALTFRDGSLKMKVVGPDADAIERINQSLRGGGLKADIVAGNPRANAYEGRVQIKGGT